MNIQALRQNAIQDWLEWAGGKVNDVRNWIGEANQRVVDKVTKDPASLNYSSGIRRMAENENNPWLMRKAAQVAYMNPFVRGTDFEAGAIKREQEKKIEAELKAKLSPEEWQKYQYDKMEKQAFDMAQNVAFNMGTINAVPGAMADEIAQGVKSGSITQDVADDYMKMLQDRALQGRSPAGNPELLTKDPLKTGSNPSVDQFRRQGIIDPEDLQTNAFTKQIASPTNSMSRSRINEYKKLIEQGADVPPVVLADDIGGNGKAIIFDGNHRAQAYKELGMPVPVSEMTVNEYRKFLTANPQFTIDQAQKSASTLTNPAYSGNVSGTNMSNNVTVDQMKEAAKNLPKFQPLASKSEFVDFDNLMGQGFDPHDVEDFARASGHTLTPEKIKHMTKNLSEYANEYYREPFAISSRGGNAYPFTENDPGKFKDARDLIKKNLGGGEHKDWFMELEDGINNLKAKGGASKSQIEKMIKKSVGGDYNDDWFNELARGVDDFVNNNPANINPNIANDATRWVIAEDITNEDFIKYTQAQLKGYDPSSLELFAQKAGINVQKVDYINRNPDLFINKMSRK